MTSLMKRTCVFVALLGSIRPINAQPKPGGNPHGRESNNPGSQPPITVNIVAPRKTDAEAAADKQKADDDSAIKGRDFVLTCVIALAAVTQAGVAFWQGHIYRRQYKTMTEALDESRKSADAATKGIAALEKIERPFLIVETRGDKGTEFWVRNCGKVPARILYLRRDLSIDYPAFDQSKQDWALPQPPYYGLNYDNPRVEQINVQWIGPGDEVHFASFSTTLFEYYGEDLKADLRSYHKVIRMYSAIKYRGLVSDEIFESRFCYGWSKDQGTYMTGSYGYNQYT